MAIMAMSSLWAVVFNPRTIVWTLVGLIVTLVQVLNYRVVSTCNLLAIGDGDGLSTTSAADCGFSLQPQRLPSKDEWRQWMAPRGLRQSSSSSSLPSQEELEEKRRRHKFRPKQTDLSKLSKDGFGLCLMIMDDNHVRALTVRRSSVAVALVPAPFPCNTSPSVSHSIRLLILSFPLPTNWLTDSSLNRSRIPKIQLPILLTAQFLVEWLAYHYHMLPLKHLTVLLDSKSITSPLQIFERWDNYADDLQIEVVDWDWPDALAPVPDYLKNETSIRHYIGRQNMFYGDCMKNYKRRKWNSWVLLTDTDEFIGLNHEMRGLDGRPPPMGTMPKRLPMGLTSKNLDIIPLASERGSVMTRLKQMERKYGDTCILTNRTQICSTDTEDWHTSHSTSLGMSDHDFLTFEWNMGHSLKNPKGMINLRKTPLSYMEGVDYLNNSTAHNIAPGRPCPTRPYFTMFHYPGNEAQVCTRSIVVGRLTLHNCGFAFDRSLTKYSSSLFGAPSVYTGDLGDIRLLLLSGEIANLSRCDRSAGAGGDADWRISGTDTEGMPSTTRKSYTPMAARLHRTRRARRSEAAAKWRRRNARVAPVHGQRDVEL